jgi:hypothetical protein
MKKLILVLLAFVCVLPAAETIQSGTVAVTATEDSVDNTITYANIRDALVIDSSPASSSTYKYRIKTLGATTKALKTSVPADVVAGTTVVVPSSPVTNQTTYLLYTPSNDAFTLFPTTSTRSTPAVVVAVVEVLDSAGTVLLATVNLTIDIQGVTDTREGVSGYYLSPGITEPDAITIPQGGSVKMNYVELAARCGWVDKERDGCAEFDPFGASGFGGSDGWSMAFDNPPGSIWPDRVFVKTGTTSDAYFLDFGDSGDYSTNSFTLTIPSNHPLGTFSLAHFAFLYYPTGMGPATTFTNSMTLSVTVVAGGGGSGSSGGGGGGGGGGGCGLGAVSGLIMLAMMALGVRWRRND